MISYSLNSPTTVRAALVVLLLCAIALPTHAALYTTPLTTEQAPGNYAGTPALGGLFTACLSTTNPEASETGRAALIVLTASMEELLTESVTTGQFYLSGFYNSTTNMWEWMDRNGAVPSVAFAEGSSGTVLGTTLVARWAAGYPQTEAGTTTIGTLRYIAYDAALKGWINVDGSAPLNGVACLSQDMIDDDSAKFPWWGILIIVLGCVAVIAIVIVVVCCCCCKKKKDRVEDDEDTSTFGSRSASFRSRGTSHSGTSGSFSSRGGSSKGSSVSGSSRGSSDGSSGSYSEGSSASTTSRSMASSSQGSHSRTSSVSGRSW